MTQEVDTKETALERLRKSSEELLAKHAAQTEQLNRAIERNAGLIARNAEILAQRDSALRHAHTLAAQVRHALQLNNSGDYKSALKDYEAWVDGGCK